jgi:hypothetical protein
LPGRNAAAHNGIFSDVDIMIRLVKRSIPALSHTHISRQGDDRIAENYKSNLPREFSRGLRSQEAT